MIKSENNRKTVIMGYGDVQLIPTAYSLDGPSEGLAFLQGEPGEVGRPSTRKSTNDLVDNNPVEVHLVFKNTESLTVLIEVLKEIREEMMSCKDKPLAAFATGGVTVPNAMELMTATKQPHTININALAPHIDIEALGKRIADDFSKSQKRMGR